MSNADLAELIWSSLAMGVAFFACIAVIQRRILTRGRAVYLDAAILYLAVQTLDMFDSIAFSPPVSAPLWLTDWADALLPFLMVTIWFFVRGLTEPAMRLRPGDAIHLLPFGIVLLCMLPHLSLPGPVRADLIEPVGIAPWRLELAEVGILGSVLAWVGIMAVYGLACARRLTRHKRTIRTLFSDLEGKTLWWLDMLVAAILFCAWLVIFDELLKVFLDVEILTGRAEGIYEVFLGLTIGLYALRAEPPLPDWSAELVAPGAGPGPEPKPGPARIVEDGPEPVSDPAPAPAADPEPVSTTAPDLDPDPDPTPRYARSGLSAPDLARLGARLKSRMEEGQLWQDPMLNLKALSEATKIPPMHLSEVLNTEIGQSFFDYINGHRIAEACSRLAESEDTVLEISEAVGYNSKSTFNANFKRITGKTPTGWRASVRSLSQAPPPPKI